MMILLTKSPDQDSLSSPLPQGTTSSTSHSTARLPGSDARGPRYPPVPARRQASHPAYTTGPPSMPDSLNLPDESQPSKSESHSAPSSPVDPQNQFPGVQDTTTKRQRSSPQSPRPRSMMVDSNSKVNYAQVAFTKEQSDRPPPPPSSRRETKYSNIIYPPSTTSAAAVSSVDSSVPPPPPSHAPRGINAVGQQQKQSSLDLDSPSRSDGLYDTPLPAMRVIPDSDPWTVRREQPKLPTATDSGSADPFTGTAKPKDPFSQDPFASSMDEWNDPAAFYDRPPPPRPHPSATSTGANVSQTVAHTGTSATNGSFDVHAEELEEETREEPQEGELFIVDNSADFTGGSTYEDATEFLVAARRASFKKKAEDGHPPGRTDIFAPAAEVYHGEDRTVDNEQTSADDVSAQYDVPPVEFDHTSGQHLVMPGRLEDGDETGGSSYEYPSALSMFPSRRDGTETNSQEEPALHMMNYTSKSSPGLVRHAGAADPRHASSSSRQDMPLPPLPMNHSSHGRPPARPQSDQPAPPPLPARPSSMKQSRDGSMCRGSGTSSSSGSGGQNQQHPPPLPPMNTSRKGAAQQHAGTPTPASEDFPPLPPRKKPNGNHPSPPPVPDSPPTVARSGAHTREDGIMELVGLGYSRSDVVRAMAISKNDSQLALMILKEFGGRY